MKNEIRMVDEDIREQFVIKDLKTLSTLMFSNESFQKMPKMLFFLDAQKVSDLPEVQVRIQGYVLMESLSEQTQSTIRKELGIFSEQTKEEVLKDNGIIKE